MKYSCLVAMSFALCTITLLADERLGMRFSLGGIESAIGGEADVSRFAYDRRALSYKTLAFRRDVAFMEAAAVNGRLEDAMLLLDYLSEVLSVEDRHASVAGTQFARKGFMDLEYAVARIINDRRATTVGLPVEELRKRLPVFKSEKLMSQKITLEQNTFRNMLLIGTALERFLREKGFLPISLDDMPTDSGIGVLERKDAWGQLIVYTRLNDTEWKLFSGGKDQVQDKTQGDEVVPGLDDVAGYVDGGIWFSSNYSSKRKELLTKRHISGSSILFDCTLLDSGIIYRGDSRRRSTQTQRTTVGDSDADAAHGIGFVPDHAGMVNVRRDLIND